MSKGKKIGAAVGVVSVAVIVIFGIYYMTPTGRAAINSYFHDVQKVDDLTRYDTRKEVEDSCRAMISSYNADALTYKQYKDSDNEEKVGWAEQAKMRANKTASTYNNYVLKNSYVWEGNIPADIMSQLEYIE